jgi:antitoxin component YwqK of YwqJK toxin-antitoxin module
MTEHITHYNELGEPHGYWEVYWTSGNLYYKGNYHNGQRHGNWEEYWASGNLWFKGAYNNGLPHGYWEWYVDGEVKIQIFYA